MQAAAIFMSGLWTAALLLLTGQCIWDNCTAEKTCCFPDGSEWWVKI